MYVSTRPESGTPDSLGVNDNMSASFLRQREVGGGTRLRLPCPNSGTLVLDEFCNSGPFRILDSVEEPLRYLDLNGCRAATSLAGFGGSAATLAGVTKLYASHCALTSLEGLGQYQSLQALYLDGCALGLDALWEGIFALLPHPEKLQCLDFRSTPAATELERSLTVPTGREHALAGRLADFRGDVALHELLLPLRRLKWLNGERWERDQYLRARPPRRVRGMGGF